MADNIYVDPGVGAGKVLIAADDVSGVLYPAVKLDLGGDGVSTPVSGTLPVSDGGGSLTVDGSVTANAGTNLNTSALALETGGNLAAIKAKTDNIPAQGQALAAASLPVVLTAAQITTLTPPAAITGFATEATLGTRLTESDFDSKAGSLTETAPATDTASSGLNGRLQRIAQRITSLIALLPAALTGSGNLKAAIVESTATVTVTGALTDTQLRASAVPVSLASVPSHAVTNAGTFAVQAAEADGANVTLGAKADAKSTATDTTAVSVMSVLKQISASVQAPPSQAVTGTFWQATQPVSLASAVPVTDNSGSLTVDNATASSLKCEPVGNIAHDSADSGNPVKIGGYAISAERAAVANGDRADFVTDLTGKQIVLPYCNPENILTGNTSAITNTTATSVISAQGSGVRIYAQYITISNSHATVGTLVSITDGSGGSTLFQCYCAPAGGGVAQTTLVKTTANTALYAVCGTTGANVYVSVQGYKGA